ncbi:hypothetical protein QBC46DRAFT_103833 [Diplogelasinospora grovesii]|uniref:Uncharacterized protein n=1 Tax=Diplogelasinospora grovesii TaxID=303347 RepID=A0AAN6S654_9PEZI|nr:hypothetical protein QBC46DRAFT_103833 [Diplogelasinospora grovesii]
MRPKTPNLKFTHSVGPSSPPQTPRATSPVLDRKSSNPKLRSMLPQNPSRRPPMASVSNIRPVGDGPNFSFTRAIRPEQLSPQDSSSSADSSSDSEADESEAVPSRSVSPEQPDPAPPAPQARTERIVTQAAFTVEEMSDFSGSDEERLDVVRPDAIEYAESDRESRARSRNPPEIDQTVMYNLGNLNCSDESDETDIDEADYREFLLKQRAERRRKRMTSGSIGKRTISESIGSDTDLEDLKPFFLGADEVGSSARRLRRRLGDRRSLLFQDPPPPRIEELEEPDSSDDELHVSETLARELPYYEYVSMEIDSP